MIDINKNNNNFSCKIKKQFINLQVDNLAVPDASVF